MRAMGQDSRGSGCICMAGLSSVGIASTPSTMRSRRRVPPASRQSDRHGLEQELRHDVPPPGAERALDAISWSAPSPRRT